MAHAAVEDQALEDGEDEVGAADGRKVVTAPIAPLEVQWTKEFWDSVHDDALPELYRFSAAALADSRQRSNVATARRAKLNPTARQVQPGRTVLVRVDNVPTMMKIFDTAGQAQAFIEYEEGRIPRYVPRTNEDPKTAEAFPVIWEEVKVDRGKVSKTTHEILH